MIFNPNVDSTFFALIIIGIVLVCIGFILKAIKFKHNYLAFYTGYFFFGYALFFIGHVAYQFRSEMKNRSGTYAVLKIDEKQSECKDKRISDLKITLNKNETFAFNQQVCFLTKKYGKWTYNNDLMGIWVSFDDIFISNMRLDYDTEKLTIMNGDNVYITFEKCK